MLSIRPRGWEGNSKVRERREGRSVNCGGEPFGPRTSACLQRRHSCTYWYFLGLGAKVRRICYTCTCELGTKLCTEYQKFRPQVSAFAMVLRTRRSHNLLLPFTASNHSCLTSPTSTVALLHCIFYACCLSLFETSEIVLSIFFSF